MKTKTKWREVEVEEGHRQGYYEYSGVDDGPCMLPKGGENPKVNPKDMQRKRRENEERQGERIIKPSFSSTRSSPRPD